MAVALLALAGWGGGGDDGGGGDAAPRTTLRVFAAASLTEAFTELAVAFEDAHPEVDVELSFAASSALAQQLLDGAPADVFASADEPNLAKVPDAEDPRIFARNRLAVIVEPGNPEDIGSLADLARGGLAVVLCAPEVPCGKLAASALDAARVELRPASLEENVKGVVAKVSLGEADAGLVYVTDAKAARGKVDTIDPTDLDGSLETRYPMAVLAGADEPARAAEFVDFVLSDAAQATLRDHGFLAP